MVQRLLIQFRIINSNRDVLLMIHHCHYKVSRDMIIDNQLWISLCQLSRYENSGTGWCNIDGTTWEYHYKDVSKKLFWRLNINTTIIWVQILSEYVMPLYIYKCQHFDDNGETKREHRFYWEPVRAIPVTYSIYVFDCIGVSCNLYPRLGFLLLQDGSIFKWSNERDMRSVWAVRRF